MAGGPDADPNDELRAYLRSIGFTEAQLEANSDRLLGLASRRVLFGDEERITAAALAERVGCDEGLVHRVRRAAGLPDAGDRPVCSPLLVEVMRSFIAGQAVLGDEVTFQFTRVLGTATAALAEAALATFATNRQQPLLEDGASLAEIARIGAEATTVLLQVVPVLDVLLRLQFEDALTGRFASETPTASLDLAIGFVDLVESTRLTLTVPAAELAGALSDFERTASDLVVGEGGRVVKRIGDAVMFVTTDAAGACRAAVAILESVGAHPVLGSARAAVTFGRVLPRDGDYFGGTVNLAARAVALAEPGTLVVDEAVRAALPGQPVVALGARSLKGFEEPVALFLLEV